MAAIQALREFINERLTAAAGEIFTAFEQTIVQYQEELDRQNRLLEITFNPPKKFHGTELQQDHDWKEDQLFEQETNCYLEQGEPEPPQIKEEQEEPGLLQFKENHEEPEPPQIKEEQEEPGQSYNQRNMSELEPTFLRSAINEVLPNLAEMSKNILEESLQSLGIKTSDDFKFLQESDLLTALRPIQARKLLAAWKLRGQSDEGSSESRLLPAPPPSMNYASPSSSASSSAISCQSPAVDWMDTYQVPWRQFPEELIQTLQREKRPTRHMRREMVRIVASDMMQRSSSVSKRNSTEIAKRMVAKYPKSLQDNIEGDVIGSGYDSLVKQLQNRIENMKRSTTPRIRKRRCQADDSDTGDVAPEKRAAIQDTYGCIKWDVKFLPFGETLESQQEKQEKLRQMSQQTNANQEVVKQLMRETFYTQRKQVNQGKNIKDLLEGWPSWFSDLGMDVHFKELTGLALKETFLQNVDKKGKQLLNFFSTVCARKSKKFLQAAMKVKMLRGAELSGCSEDVKEMVLLLMAYFDESEENMLANVEDSCLAGQVQIDKLPLSPTIVVCGQSCFKATRFMLSVDRVIVQENIPSFVSSLCLMFGSYYSFNIHYPSGLASTLEFLQRCFFSINPEKGTKVEKSSSSCLHMNPRVLTLIQDLSEHEWWDI
ncbi:uncharacterized protein LOC115402957 isoform X1 [Salarias fasciatus]|uniref:uncharacterized protein LOC115402957 isoform X1 n=1 Tax=Salarias fasciatus TaxID=181472 RepID=UPI00117653AF|nr:uncharacterized protein LOC115402957 isoform X1 [Salarias fasciatus]XP_029967527.1 uncharacterized protein LOC115402957 isoform X1 [Salarias fasciatus]XP_029967536.1 uncharacterized protein LOC115402957 isoform X1 [Salarias fasciatus]